MIDDSPWEKLRVNIQISDCLTRKVLFEKYNWNKSVRSEVEIKMNKFLLYEINGCDLFTNKSHKEYIFFVKDMVILFQQDIKNKKLYISQELWSFFEKEYKLTNYGVEVFTKKILNKLLKVEEHKTASDWANSVEMFQNSLSSKNKKSNV